MNNPTIIKKPGRKGVAARWYIFGITEPVFIFDGVSLAHVRIKLNDHEHPMSHEADHARQAAGEVASHFMSVVDTTGGFSLWLLPHPDAR